LLRATADYLYRNETDAERRTYFLEQFLDRMLTVFAATLLASLEQSIYDGLEQNQIRNADDLDKLTRQIGSRYSIWHERHRELDARWSLIDEYFAGLPASKNSMRQKFPPLFTNLFLLLLVWGLTPCQRLAAQSSKTQTRSEKVRRILQDFRDKSGFPGAIAGVYFADGTSLAVAVGYANRETRTPMRKSDLLHAGSVGKMLFASLALQLIAERRMSLDDRIEQYLGRESWFARLPNGKDISVRMLLNHTSGLPEFGDEFMRGLAQFPSRERSPLEGVKSVLGAKPLHPAGTKFSYSDVNYLVLGLVIEQVSGKSAYGEIRRRVLKPLALRRILPADRPVIPGLVPGYAGASNPFGGDEIMKNGRLVFDPRFEWAAGGFVANAEDLARWIAAFCQGRAFNSKLLPEVFKGVDAPGLGKGARYGFGVVIEDTPIGKAYGHGGFFPGYVTWVRWYSQQRTAVALQLNTSDDALIARPVRDVMNDLVTALYQSPRAKAPNSPRPHSNKASLARPNPPL